jgi:hypothetical protein
LDIGRNYLKSNGTIDAMTDKTNDPTDACQDCGESKSDGHFHITLSPQDVAVYKQMHDHFARQREMQDIERTRTVNLNYTNDLLDHLKSTNGHGVDDYMTRHPRSGNYAHPELYSHYGEDWAKMRSAYHPRYGFSMEDMPESIPGVRDLTPGEPDFELTHSELRSVHSQLHKTWPEEHVNEGEYENETHRHV